ncbi:MAG: ECF transporter S component [Oscillospiraceae bacterium]|nr:ECF transporter S component [Oscillospiraceae bacterium]
MREKKVSRLTMAAMMGAVAFVLMYFSFSIPVLSPFAEFEFAALAELIGGFILGPVGVLEIVGVKLLLKIVFKGTQSMMTGELQNLILSVAFALPAVLYYRRHRTKKAAAIGLLIGSAINVVAAVLTSLYMIFPFYISLYGMDWDSLVGMCSAVNPWIKDVPTMVAFSVIPFNVAKCVVHSLITMLVYKKLSVPLKKLIK